MIIALRHNKAVKAELRIFNILSQLCGGCDSNGLTDLLQKQNSAKESEGFNAQSYNYGANNSVAHVIAHRSITAGLDTSYVYDNNNLYSGGNSNGSVRKSVWSNCCSTYNYIWNQRNGSNRNTGQNNRVVCLSEATNEQDRLNNSKNRTVVVIGIGPGKSETYTGEQTSDILTGRPLLEEYGHTVFRIVRPLFFCMTVAWFLRKNVLYKSKGVSL